MTDVTDSKNGSHVICHLLLLLIIPLHGLLDSLAQDSMLITQNPQKTNQKSVHSGRTYNQKIAAVD